MQTQTEWLRQAIEEIEASPDEAMTWWERFNDGDEFYASNAKLTLYTVYGLATGIVAALMTAAIILDCGM
jgi:tetrahydromethanopterin S-methyltransferase subunit B